MKNILATISVMALASVSAAEKVDLSKMTQFLDDMETHYKGAGSKYDRVFLNELTECLGKWDDDTLLKSQNSAWSGIDSDWKSNGTSIDTRGEADHWGECSKYDADRDCNKAGHAFLRSTPELFGPEKIIMYEPCNYVSNLAYYHAVT